MSDERIETPSDAARAFTSTSDRLRAIVWLFTGTFGARSPDEVARLTAAVALRFNGMGGWASMKDEFLRYVAGEEDAP